MDKVYFCEQESRIQRIMRVVFVCVVLQQSSSGQNVVVGVGRCSCFIYVRSTLSKWSLGVITTAPFTVTATFSRVRLLCVMILRARAGSSIILFVVVTCTSFFNLRWWQWWWQLRFYRCFLVLFGFFVFFSSHLKRSHLSYSRGSRRASSRQVVLTHVFVW